MWGQVYETYYTGARIDSSIQSGIAMLACYAVKDSSVTLTMTQNSWADVTNASNDLLKNKASSRMTLAGDSIVANDACDFASVFWEVSADFTANDQYKGQVIKISGTDTTGMGCAQYEGKGQVGILTSKCMTSVAEGDIFKLQLVNTSDNDDAIVKCARMVIIKEF